MRLFVLLFLFLLHLHFLGQEQDSCNLWFSHPSGIYPSGINLCIYKSDSVKVFFTTDGSAPSSSSKKMDSMLCVNLDSNFIFRAVVYNRKGKKIERIAQSYLVGRSFSTAVVSIIVEPDDFFSYDRGIYVKGCCASEDPPYKGANFWKGWERVANIEFYESNGALAFNQKATVRIFGGFSKGLPMKSLAVISKKKYGNKYFEYPLFPDKPIKKYKSFILRNSGGDFNKAHFRDAFITNLVSPLDMEIQAYRPVVVFINGQYWGIHNLREKINEYFLKYNCGVDKDKVDILRHNKQLQYGTRKHYLSLIRYLEQHNFSDIENIRTLNKKMDIDNFINYNITEIYIHNKDAGGNIRYWRARNDTARWRWILYDTDLSFAISNEYAYKENTLKQMTTKNDETWPNPPWSTFIIRKLLENDSIETVYINRFADLLNSIFSSEYVLQKIDSSKNLIEKEMPLHLERWKSSNLKKWELYISRMKTFTINRPSYIRRFLMDKFNLEDTVLVAINLPETVHGKIKLNSLNIDSTFKGYYFKNIPITLQAKADIGYKFNGWTDSLTAENITLSPNTDTIILTPVFSPVALSPNYKQVVINEMCIKSDTTIPTKDWIELYNTSDTTVDITNWKIVINNTVSILKENKILLPHEYYIIARRPSLLDSTYKNINLATDSLQRGIPSKAGRVWLLDAKGEFIDSLEYNIYHNFNTVITALPIILEKVNPYQSSNIANWNINNFPTIGKRNRAFKPKTPKRPKKQWTDQFSKRQKVWGIILGVSLLILVIVAMILYKK